MKKILLIIVMLFVFTLSACKPAAVVTPTLAPTAAVKPTEVVQEPTKTAEPIVYEPVTIKINGATNMGYAPLYIAEKEGYFAQYGITLEKIKFSRVTEAIPLLASGDLDVYSGSVNTGLLNVLSQDPNVKVVADRGTVEPGACTYHAIVVRKDLYDSGMLTKPADFKGQMVSASNAGQQGFQLSSYIAAGGLTLDDLQIQTLQPASYLDAFANKSIAAIVTAEPYITLLVNSGNGVVLSRMEDFGTIQLSVLAFGKNLVVDHPDIGARFLAAYLLGVKKYNEGKTEENLQILAETTGEDPAVLKEECWLTIHSDGKISFKGVDVFQQWSVAQKQLEKPVTEEQFWDPSFLEATKAILPQ